MAIAIFTHSLFAKVEGKLLVGLGGWLLPDAPEVVSAEFIQLVQFVSCLAIPFRK